MVFAILLLFVSVSVNDSTKGIDTGIGDDVVINQNKDVKDCSGYTLVAVSKEARDEAGRLMVANDTVGLAKMVLYGTAFLVQNCTAARVIDVGVAIREVRVMDGKMAGESGWIPYEFARKPSS